MWVKCVGVDEKTGKVRLSRKAAMKEMEQTQQGEAGVAPAAAAPTAQ
jgi:polyribonucleotide nucleotidyltransferase